MHPNNDEASTPTNIPFIGHKTKRRKSTTIYIPEASPSVTQQPAPPTSSSSNNIYIKAIVKTTKNEE